MGPTMTFCRDTCLMSQKSKGWHHLCLMDTAIYLQKIMNIKEENRVIHHLLIFKLKRTLNCNIVNYKFVLKQDLVNWFTLWCSKGNWSHCENDTDTLIVSTALDFATEIMPARMIAADTDVLIMLLYFWTNEMANILVLSDLAQSLKITKSLWY